MPTYDYRCDGCGRTFDVFRPMSRVRDPAHCDVCGDEAKRVFTGVPIIFRPDGWNLHPGDPGYSDIQEKGPRLECQQ